MCLCVSVCLSLPPSLPPSLPLSICLSVCLSLSVSVSLCNCQPAWLIGTMWPACVLPCLCSDFDQVTDRNETLLHLAAGLCLSPSSPPAPPDNHSCNGIALAMTDQLLTLMCWRLAGFLSGCACGALGALQATARQAVSSSSLTLHSVWHTWHVAMWTCVSLLLLLSLGCFALVNGWSGGEGVCVHMMK